MSVQEVAEVSILTSCIDVKIGGFVGHVACRFQTWSSSMDFTGITHVLCHIYCVGALVNVLTSKQHFHLTKKNHNEFNTFNSIALSYCVMYVEAFASVEFCT